MLKNSGGRNEKNDICQGSVYQAKTTLGIFRVGWAIFPKADVYEDDLFRKVSLEISRTGLSCLFVRVCFEKAQMLPTLKSPPNRFEAGF